jgi:hypothetical protein
MVGRKIRTTLERRMFSNHAGHPGPYRNLALSSELLWTL